MAARLEGPLSLEESYRHCRELNRRSGTTYYAATWLLPSVKRHHVHALYGFCRHADDIVDDLGPVAAAERHEALRDFEGRFWADLDAGRSDHPVLKAVVHTVRAFDIDRDCFRRFLRSMAMDLTVERYQTFDELLVYMDGSAAVIGEMMLPILEPMSSEALGHARDLGIAFQLTNFCRDVAEDLDRGRVYLPQEDVQRFGAARALARRQVTPEWIDLMRFELERARTYYRSGHAGVALLPPVSARCVVGAIGLYAGILEQIEAAGYDVWSARVRVPAWRKAAVAARMLRPVGARMLRPGCRPSLPAGRPARSATGGG
jgi:15-cis-phytoene synthase